MGSLWQDLRYGARMLLRKPGFTIVAVLTLAFGIGVNSALFTGFNIFLRPKPIKDPSAVVRLDYQGARSSRTFAFPDYVYLRDNAQAFSEVIASFEETFLLGEKGAGSEPEEIVGNFIAENLHGIDRRQRGAGTFFLGEGEPYRSERGGCGADSSFLASALWRRPGNDRPFRAAQRQAVYRHWRDKARVCRSQV